MVVIRLARHGAKKAPFYHINVAEKTSPRDGKFIERLGFYNPIHKGNAERVRIDLNRYAHWRGVGAQPTDRVVTLVREYRKIQEAQAAREAQLAESARDTQETDIAEESQVAEDAQAVAEAQVAEETQAEEEDQVVEEAEVTETAPIVGETSEVEQSEDSGTSVEQKATGDKEEVEHDDETELETEDSELKEATGAVDSSSEEK